VFEALEKGIGTMSFTINRQHYEIFTEIANETGWPAARKPRSWAQGVGAEESHQKLAFSQSWRGEE
jgi:hypothetical protein